MFTVKKDAKTIVPVLLTDEQKNLITDLYVSTNGDAIATKHKMGRIRVSSGLIKQEFARKVYLFEKVKQVMAGKLIIEPEVTHIDEEIERIVIDKKAVYNTVPKTIAGLKIESAKLVGDNKAVSDHIVDKIVQCADSTDKCTWDKFELMFKEVKNELVK